MPEKPRPERTKIHIEGVSDMMNCLQDLRTHFDGLVLELHGRPRDLTLGEAAALTGVAQLALERGHNANSGEQILKRLIKDLEE